VLISVIANPLKVGILLSRATHSFGLTYISSFYVARGRKVDVLFAGRAAFG